MLLTSSIAKHYIIASFQVSTRKLTHNSVLEHMTSLKTSTHLRALIRIFIPKHKTINYPHSFVINCNSPLSTFIFQKFEASPPIFPQNWLARARQLLYHCLFGSFFSSLKRNRKRRPPLYSCT